MNNTAFLVLIGMCIAGFFLGLYYYFKPEQLVRRRIKEEHRELAARDADFRHWMEQEIQTQTKRTRKVGLFMIIIQFVWLIAIMVLWQGNYFKFK